MPVRVCVSDSVNACDKNKVQCKPERKRERGGGGGGGGVTHVIVSVLLVCSK